MGDAHEQIEAVLLRRFPDNDMALSHFAPLLAEYVESGLSRTVIGELETGDEHKLWSNIWEAMLYRHLRTCGHTPRNLTTRAGQNGPDFAVDVDGKTIWIEAIVPTPEGIPVEWLETPRKGELKVRSRPDTERVLRCTHSVDQKQRKFAEYQSKGIISPNDCTVIAVNICMLSYHDIDGDGISGAPLCAEAVYPFGPRGVLVSREGEILGPMSNVERYEIPKPNRQPVNTWAFLHERFANVSAVLQTHERWVPEKGLPVAIMHNPTASNPLPQGLFRPYCEYVGTPAEDEGYHLRDIVGRRARRT